MRKLQTSLTALAFLLVLASCKSEKTTLTGAGGDLEVVTEGEASGGGAAPPLTGEVPPMTNTNIDTTTSFSLGNPGAMPPNVATDSAGMPIPAPVPPPGIYVPPLPTAPPAPAPAPVSPPPAPRPRIDIRRSAPPRDPAPPPQPTEEPPVTEPQEPSEPVTPIEEPDSDEPPIEEPPAEEPPPPPPGE